MQFLLAFLLVCTPLQDVPAGAQVIVRHDDDGAADEDEELVESWIAQGDELVCGGRRVPLTRLVELRERILEQRCLVENLPQVPEVACLQAMGLDAEAFEAHREEWFLASLPDFWKLGGGISELAAETETLFTWERCATDIALLACGRGINSVHGPRLTIELLGEPPLQITNWSELPWLLPWQVQSGARRWLSADVGISKTAQYFSPAEGPFVELLDGESYWRGEFWSAPYFWRKRAFGGAVDDILCRRAYEQLEGWGLADGFLRVHGAKTSIAGLALPSMELDLTWRSPSPVERVRWLNPRLDRELSHSWIDLLSAWQDAKRTVVREAWIDAWKTAGSNRILRLELGGVSMEAGPSLEAFTMKAWAAAGFRGRPDWELRFQRGGDLAATVFLSRDQPGALVFSADPGPGEHWLDAQDIGLDPHADSWTCGRVDAAGRLELLTLL